MLTGYALANSQRCWYVPDFNVWGTSGWGVFDFLMVEHAAVDTILFDSLNISSNAQEINFNDLTDFRGNNLPLSIKNPKVFIKPRSGENTFIVGAESDNSFKIARDSGTNGPVIVDLFVLELGE